MTRNNKLHNILSIVRRFDIGVLSIFFVYIILRIFLPFKAYWIWGDEAKYLVCAKSFPFNRMFNHSFYDFHPVFYPYMIRLFNIFFEDHIAAIAVSFFASLILFMVVYRLLVFLNLKRGFIYIALTYIAFSRVLLGFSNIIFRYELFVCLFFLSFYMYLKGITTFKVRYLVLSALFGGLTFMTSDLMPFILLPALLGAFFVFGFRRRDAFVIQCKKILPILLIVLIYFSCVLLPKFIIYSTHTYYASGVEGRIERVSEFGLKQLIHPIYFPNSYAVWGKSQMSVDLNCNNIENKIFSIIELENFEKPDLAKPYKIKNKIKLFIYRCLLFLMFLPMLVFLKDLFRALFFRNKYPFINTLKHYKVDLYLFIILIGILYPIIYTGFISRNSIAAIPFLAYFLAKGLEIIFSIKNIIVKKFIKGLTVLFVILSVVYIINLSKAYMTKGYHFVFDLDRIEQTDKVSAVLDKLLNDGVLADGLIADALVYNCKKRIVTLPRSPDPESAQEQTDLSIEVFDLNYVVISEFWKIELDILAYPAIDYIKDNPDKFKLMTTVYENYDKGISANTMREDDTFYIYEIIKDKGKK